MSYGPNPWVQAHWDRRAAANFIFGGSGSGLLVAAALVSAGPWPILIGLLMIAAGLTAVWLETGRKLRALHVLFNPFTSWMTREAFAAVLVFPLGIAAIELGTPWTAAAAALAAAAFLYCQARLLQAAKGIPAWRAPRTVPLIVSAGLAEGAALCLLFSSGALATALSSPAPSPGQATARRWPGRSWRPRERCWYRSAPCCRSPS
jgi:phenylacetyl-CoA:acceptor oxidoreductase subunit 2